MAIAQGFGKTSSAGLIFGYDTGDMDNSFKGAPKTNLLSYYGRTYGNQSSSVFKTQYYTREVFVPTLGTRSVETMETYNDYGGGSGVCCQQAWNLGGSGVSGSTQYTYSIIYRSSSGYTHPNFMYRYEYGASGYITEGGLHNDGNRTHLGDGWYHAWGNLTTQPGTTTMYFYFYMYEYATYNTIDLAGIMFTQGPEILRPRQFIPFGTTRSVTQGLLDLTGNYTIDLSNISFDSTGNIAFDGTNDFIDTNFPAMTINNPTIEAVVYRDTNTGRYEAIIQNNLASDDALYVFPGGVLGFWPCSASSLTVPTGRWSYVAVSYNGTTLTYCVNGTIQVVTSSCEHITDWDFLRIGAAGSGDGERWIGKIAVSRVYDRALSATELTQNYSHYKTRFNL
jgi:hypothetical protein